MAASTTDTIRAKVNGVAAKAKAYAEANGINLPPLRTDSTPDVALESSAFASGFKDTLAAMGVSMPSWQRLAFGFVGILVAGVATYFAAPVLASILTAGTLSVTANGFALWLASALGYLVAAYLSVKSVQLVGKAASWIARLGGSIPVAA